MSTKITPGIMKQYSIGTICGSMRFREHMLKAAEYLSLCEWIVLMPFCVYPKSDYHKRMLDDMHFAKIRQSDYIYVITDESRYYGDSTKREIEYAKLIGVGVAFRDDSVEEYNRMIRSILDQNVSDNNAG